MVAKVSIAPGFEQHFFISYSWAGAGKELARRLEQNLRHDGYTVWVDVTRMSGNINDAMAEGINTSMVFIPIMDIHYGKSANCKKELNYASDIRKAIVPIRLTNQLPEGEKFIIAGLLHFELDSRLWRPRCRNCSVTARCSLNQWNSREGYFRYQVNTPGRHR
ncbi:TIR domain-containing protein [Cladochytrium replicatum]|nr:TIR domain-containing protein [Cladochytrium replicatum]